MFYLCPSSLTATSSHNLYPAACYLRAMFLLFLSLFTSLVHFILFCFLPLTVSVKHVRTVRGGFYAPDYTPVINRCIRASLSRSRLF